ncbi:MAG: CPBP family intramembrane metalloprotease [Clostridiales bacterium]|nr:CPBP family intramembrane metalloprotease [Clostridiales bacterium]
MTAKRGIKTIIGSFFRKRGQMGAQASSASFLASVVFVMVLFFVAVSWMIYRFPYHLFSDEVYNVVVVNAPESFVRFNEETQVFRDKSAKMYGDRYDIFGNYDNIINFQYRYDGYGLTKFIYKENDALYDFVTFGKWMRENDAYLTVVFPADFDEQIQRRQEGLTTSKPQILTYYRTNSLEYSSMKKGFIDDYLYYYQVDIREHYGYAVTSFTDSHLVDKPIVTVQNANGIRAVVESLCRSFIPILLFITLLYTSMSIGTNVIAGQKERGTFTGILLTPQPRYAIVVGYLGGVVLKAMIPSFFIATISSLFAGQFSITGYLALYLYLFVLEVFIASITILISVINDTVISAQTAFLPIFLTLVAVCVTCIQSVNEREDFYMFLPVHGQFYGIGDVLVGKPNVAGLVVSSLLTLLLSALIVFITERLLHSERYTVSVDSVNTKEVRRRLEGGKPTAWESVNQGYDNLNFIINEAFYPLVVLSVYQTLAMIPVAVSYMRKAEYSDFISDLSNVKSLPEIFDKTFEVFGIFFRDPLFLALMALGYVLVIITYFIHAGRVWRIKGIKEKISACGYPLSDRKHIISHYLLGLVFGFLMMSCTVAIMILTGQISLSGFSLSLSGLGVFLFNVIMWIPQGASEELMFRGFMLRSFSKRFKPAVGIIVSSIMFSAMHSLNKGYTPLASVNLVLIAVLFALIYYLTGDIWMTSAMHTAWNLTQGNIYGLQVSGNDSANSIVTAIYGNNASTLITGGSFGPEGGLATTAVTAVCLVIVIVLLIRKNRK